MISLEQLALNCDEKAKKWGSQWKIRCPNPAHDDKTPSCYLKEGETGIVWHCHGCKDQQGVLEGLKLNGYEYKPSADSAHNWKRGSEQDAFRDAIKAAIKEARAGSYHRITSDYMVYGAQLPPPRFICGPFQNHSSGFIAAPGGSGKSMFTLGLAKAMAEGEAFCGWAIPKPLKVYMVDVEMSDPGLYGRLTALGYYPGLNVTFDTSDQRDAVEMGRFQLGPEGDMARLMIDASQADVIIIDNVSACLMPGQTGDLFSPETWQQVFTLESWARREGKLLIFVDHTNKGGALAGSLHKHRMADFVCLLERTSIIGEPWLEFLFWVDKNRNDADAEDVMPRLVRLEDGEWTHSDPNEADDEVLRQVLEKQITKKEAAEEIGCSRTTLDKKLKQFMLRRRRKQRDHVK